MQTFVNQLPALIGVVIGALGAFWVASATDRMRWRREQETRWDERRLEAYAQYARTIKEMHAVALRLLAARHSALAYQPIERDLGLELLASAEMERTKAWESVLLLGDAATIEAARVWRNTVMKIALLARDQDDPDVNWEHSISIVIDEVNEARDRFYICARKGVAVTGNAQAQAPWLRAESIRSGHDHLAHDATTAASPMTAE